MSDSPAGRAASPRPQHDPLPFAICLSEPAPHQPASTLTRGGHAPRQPVVTTQSTYMGRNLISDALIRRHPVRPPLGRTLGTSLLLPRVNTVATGTERAPKDWSLRHLSFLCLYKAVDSPHPTSMQRGTWLESLPCCLNTLGDPPERQKVNFVPVAQRKLDMPSGCAGDRQAHRSREGTRRPHGPRPLSAFVSEGTLPVPSNTGEPRPGAPCLAWTVPSRGSSLPVKPRLLPDGSEPERPTPAVRARCAQRGGRFPHG